MSALSLGLGVWMGLATGVPCVLDAQRLTDQLTLRALPATDSVARAVQEAAARADTGRMMPAYQDLSRYDTPGYCLAALRTAERVTWRRGERDTVPQGAPIDTLPTSAVTIGRTCATKFQVGTVSVAELRPLFMLSILVGDTARAHAVMERQLALAPTTEARGFVLFDAVELLLREHPSQPAAARALISQLDALGAEARVPRYLAHTMMLNDVVRIHFDTAAILAESRALREVLPLLTAEELNMYVSGSVLHALDSVYAAWLQRDPELPEVLRRSLQREFDAAGARIQPEAKQFMMAWMTSYIAGIGTVAPPLPGAFWFPDTLSRTRPTPGKVTLLYMARKGNGRMSNDMAMLRRLHDRYAKQGLEIILVLRTLGYSWSSPPQKPAEEAQTIAWYFQDYLGLPFPVVVDSAPVTHYAGMRIPGEIEFEKRYPLRQVLVGRDGKIFTQWLGFESEAQLDQAVRQAIEQ